MPDKLSPEQRHKCMSHIRGKDTKPEMIVRKYLYHHGFRYRVNTRKMPGSPDIVMRRLHTIIMVNGCFWHGHNLQEAEGDSSNLLVRKPLLLVDSVCCKIPKSNTEFWVKKIRRNMERDREDREQLVSHGWNVITVWECELKPKVREKTLQSLLYTLSQIELKLAKPKRYEMGEESVRMVADGDSQSEYDNFLGTQITQN